MLLAVLGSNHCSLLRARKQAAHGSLRSEHWVFRGGFQVQERSRAGEVWWKGWAGVEEHVPWRCRRRRGGQVDDDPEGACDALWCDGPADDQGGAWMHALCGCTNAAGNTPIPAAARPDMKWV